MRAVYVCVGLLSVAGGLAMPAHAQRALDAAAAVRQTHPPAALLTLRPQPGLEGLAEEVAAVLELRTGQRVEVGDAPPPGVLEAVPAGHVAMALHEGAVLLVLGAPGGRSFDAAVELESQGGASAARAVALAAEDLRDTAVELARRDDESAAEPQYRTTRRRSPFARAARRCRGPCGPAALRSRRRPRATRAMGPAGAACWAETWIRSSTYAYMAAHRPRATPCRAGSAPGSGCACSATACSSPASCRCWRPAATSSTCAIATRPSSRASTPGRSRSAASRPGASLGFLTRLGHFEADMGFGDRASTPTSGRAAAWSWLSSSCRGLDLMAEGGVDFTIDRAPARDRRPGRNARATSGAPGAKARAAVPAMTVSGVPCWEPENLPGSGTTNES